ncbi:MAG TPA: hypothetical protein VFG10_17805 [Saprospiraceae bacterium]|nr:hypothetical protein [Saprospiraceae bacterium]
MRTKAQAALVNYELHTLGWKAFQSLCATIVSEIWGQTVQTYFDSNDGGRDGAFQGVWIVSKEQLFEGTFTIQCKFTSKADRQLKLSDLKDEVVKAERLASKGLADNYFLFSNANLTAKNDEIIREAFEGIPGIKKFKTYGLDWLSRQIRESPRLRMLVPRIYGLGDLSQIMDERAYGQATEILSALGDDLSKFVITNAFRKSASAINDHGFVLLLGEAACGKSTIAAALALGAIDKWNSSTVKICSPSEFSRHWNPNEPKQLFWVDDAFGATQVDWSKTFEWNNLFPHVQTAIKKGAKIIFTSRDYVYKRARESLKETALPLLKESQVVINVQEITKIERQQILYNHIKLGDQSRVFKSNIKQFLASAAEHPKFSPEIARRLGNRAFTKSLNVSHAGIEDFILRPMDFLTEIIRTLDEHSRAALALIFMRAGTLPSPIEMTDQEERAVGLLSSSPGKVRTAFSPLDGSLLLNVLEDGCHVWRYKHPTIRDAFASLVAEDLELMDIYLTGSPMDKIFQEVTCGNCKLDGVKVIVPANRYDFIIRRIQEFDISQWYNKSALMRFLAFRCDKSFLHLFLVNNPSFLNSLNVISYLNACSEINLIIKLQTLKLLPEVNRIVIVNTIKDLAVSTPDAGFLSKEVRKIITDKECLEILEAVRLDLLPNLETTIKDLEYSFESKNDPDEHFGDLKSSLDRYKLVFEDDAEATTKIEIALTKIDTIIDNLHSQYSKDDSDYEFQEHSKIDPSMNIDRSIFDDIDS